MASTKDSNTSKTAHVMNLLSRNRGAAASDPAPETASAPPAPEAAHSSAAPAAPAAAAPAQAPIAPILSSMEADAAVSNQIKDALEGALASALEEGGAPVILDPPPAAAPVQCAAEAPPAAIQWQELGEDDARTPAAPVQEAPAAPVPASDPEVPAAAPVQPDPAPPSVPEAAAPVQPEPAPVPAPEPAKEDPKDGISCFNVMEALVEDKLEKYMKMYGMCQCPRCTVDVKATALNGLPGKYVVMGKNEFIPRISVYEGRFAAAVTAQLLRACKLVSDNPHHNRQD